MDDDALAPARGVLNGLLMAAPLWALIILGGIALAGCARDDGAGDLWKAVQHMEQRR